MSTHLHFHTKYSLLDGANTIDVVVDTADRYRMPALAITDHGNMFGVIEFYQAAMKKGIKPIIGCEAYIAPKGRLGKKDNYGIPNASFHMYCLHPAISDIKTSSSLLVRPIWKVFITDPV